MFEECSNVQKRGLMLKCTRICVPLALEAAGLLGLSAGAAGQRGLSLLRRLAGAATTRKATSMLTRR